MRPLRQKSPLRNLVIPLYFYTGLKVIVLVIYLTCRLWLENSAIRDRIFCSQLANFTAIFKTMPKLRKLEITLNNPQIVYFPGQVIQGQVIIELAEDMKMRGKR